MIDCKVYDEMYVRMTKFMTGLSMLVTSIQCTYV